VRKIRLLILLPLVTVLSVYGAAAAQASTAARAVAAYVTSGDCIYTSGGYYLQNTAHNDVVQAPYFSGSQGCWSWDYITPQSWTNPAGNHVQTVEIEDQDGVCLTYVPSPGWYQAEGCHPADLYQQFWLDGKWYVNAGDSDAAGRNESMTANGQPGNEYLYDSYGSPPNGFEQWSGYPCSRTTCN
jgi:hypothetical protein